MITRDDRRVREALIQTYALFEDPANFTRRRYVRETKRGIFNRVSHRSYCLMGGVAANLAIKVEETVFPATKSPLYVDVWHWFNHCVPGPWGPEGFSDRTGCEGVREFLAERINDLDAEIHKDAPMPEKLIEQVSRSRSLVMTMLSIFG